MPRETQYEKNLERSLRTLFTQYPRAKLAAMSNGFVIKTRFALAVIGIVDDVPFHGHSDRINR